MANLTKAAWGEGSMKGVGLLISVYDNSRFETKAGKAAEGEPRFRKDGQPVNEGGQYMIPRIHPDDPRAVGQVVPELRFKTGGPRPQVSMPLYDSQLEDLKANSESFPLTDKDGNVVGTNYVTRADLMERGKNGPNPYLMPITTTFQADPSLSSEPDVLDRSFELRAEAKAARAAAKEAKGSPEAAAPEAAADDKAAKRSAAATKAAATRRANKAKAKAAEAAEVSADEPSLG